MNLEQLLSDQHTLLVDPSTTSSTSSDPPTTEPESPTAPADPQPPLPLLSTLLASMTRPGGGGDQTVPAPLFGPGSPLYDAMISMYLAPTFLAQLSSTLAGNTPPPPPMFANAPGLLQVSPLFQFPNINSAAVPPLKIGGAQERSRGSTPSKAAERIVPSNDKEGWCRNKKYIAKIPNGFMCTVCKKVYGRYNSVSYHVTIYHRNPPIKCGLAGCDFTTREARYIHFHKYYRHGIELPESIDLGSRRCPFCRHVSKSPAMLEKHMARHEAKKGDESSLIPPAALESSLADTLRALDANPLMTSITNGDLSSSTDTSSASPTESSPITVSFGGSPTRAPSDDDAMADNENTAESTEGDLSDSKDTSPTPDPSDGGNTCTQCSYRATSPSLLVQHISFAHSSDVFIRPAKCLLCPFSATSQAVLAQHTLSAHLLPSQEEESF